MFSIKIYINSINMFRQNMNIENDSNQLQNSDETTTSSRILLLLVTTSLQG